MIERFRRYNFDFSGVCLLFSGQEFKNCQGNVGGGALSPLPLSVLHSISRKMILLHNFSINNRLTDCSFTEIFSSGLNRDFYLLSEVNWYYQITY